MVGDGDAVDCPLENGRWMLGTDAEVGQLTQSAPISSLLNNDGQVNS